MSTDILDYIVVGSGCSGAMAAQTLVENGAKVTMLDAGAVRPDDAAIIPDKDFLTIRRTEADQYRYLIGDTAENVSWGTVGKGEQITPPRQHIKQHVDSLIPMTSRTFSPLESLGYGGLGIGWGLQCWEFSRYDLEQMGRSPDSMATAYETVSRRIGISATDDDAAAYTLGTLSHYDPSPKMDRNHQLIYKRYLAHKKRYNRRGFHMGRTPLALLTKRRDDRRAYAYRDMDYYSDNDQSAWRPWITIDTLRKRLNFTYLGGLLVTSFDEKRDHTEVTCLEIASGKQVVFRCRHLILGSSALGSARLVLRSLGQPKDRLPLLCNPYSYIPCIQPALIGKGAESKKLGFTQLSLFYDRNQSNTDVSVASLYSYQSLMLFRIIRHVPLSFREARILMQYLVSGIVIMGIHHPDQASPSKYVQLKTDKRSPTGDSLFATYNLSSKDKTDHARREKEYAKVMRNMGVYKIKKLDPGNGASIHYAGTLPFSDTDVPFTLSPEGRLHGTRAVYVADSAGFKYLPAKGLTFSLMANAHLVAESALRHA